MKHILKKHCEKLFILDVAMILWVANVFAQLPDTLWTKTYGGAVDDYGTSVQVTTDSGYIIAGNTNSFGAGNTDVYLLKTDTNGDTIWAKIYGQANEDVGNSVLVTIDGGYLVAGYTRLIGANRTDVYLIKTDADGDTLWTKTYGGTWSDQGWSVQKTLDGGYVIAGCTEIELMGDAYLIKTDVNGNIAWTMTYGGTLTDWANAVQVTSDSGYILAGFTGYMPNYDVYLVKTDHVGNLVWSRTYGGPHDDVAWAVQQLDDTGYVVAGWTESFGVGERDVYLLRLNADGDTIWAKTYGGAHDDAGMSIQKTSDGGYIIAGSTNSFGAGEADIYLLKVDASGNTVWSTTFGGIELERGFSVQETHDHGYIIVGFTCTFGIGGPDVYLVRTEPDLGISELPHSGSMTRIPSVHVFPNPFREQTVISYQIPDLGEHRLLIYDITGRLIKDLSRQLSVINPHSSVIWDGMDNAGEQVPSGVYVFSVETGDYRLRERIVFVK